MPSEDGQHRRLPKARRVQARETAGRILDATGQRARAGMAKRNVGRALTALGIRNGIPSGDYLEDVRRFMKLSTPPPFTGTKGGRRPRVAFVAPYGLYPPAVHATGILATALMVRGAEVTVVTCDEALPACEATCVVDYREPADFLDADRPNLCGSCYDASEAAFDAFRVSRLPLSVYSSPELRQQAWDTAETFRDTGLAELYDYRQGDMELGQVVRTSLYRFFLRGTLADTEDMRAFARRYLRASLETAGMMERFVDNWRPDVILAHDGVYLIGGTSLAVAQSRGVNRVAWDVGYRRSSVLASHKGSYVRELRLDKSASWNKPLSPRESRALDIYLEGRRRGAMDSGTYHPSPLEGREAVLAATGLREGERLVSLFTNVVWDARVYAPETLFRGPVEWMVETIRHTAATPCVRYVVRVHPAEVKNIAVPTQERMDDQIRAAFPELPDNLVVIPPEHDISSYSLAAASDLAVVYSTQMGLESLTMGVATVVAGDAPYSRKGLGIEPPDRSSYYELLTHPGGVPPMTADDVERARRFVYHFFFRRMIILPDIDATRTGLPRVRNLRDLREGRYAGLDTVCNGILSGAPFEAEDATALQSILSGTVY